MIVGKTLGRWLVDSKRQLETVAAIETFGRSLRDSPPMLDLRRELASTGDADAILAAAAGFLDRIGDIDAMVGMMIRAALADHYYRPPLRRIASPVHLGLLLVDGDTLSILLAVTTPDALAAKRTWRTEPASITLGGQRSIFKFLKAGGATLSFWEAPPLEARFTADERGRCRLVGRRRIEDGEAIMLDGRSQSFVIDHAVSDIVYLQAVTPVGAAPLSVEYDSDTMAFAGASSTDEESSRVQMMVTLLRIMDRTDALPLLREVLGHPHFYVRWHAMRELLALDAEAALPSLRELAAS
ncbi:MAG: HEAT repeat domain-containing protein, partial [Gammaproteobacteria bacterium]